MSERHTTYVREGRTVEIREDANSVSLTIDGHPVEVTKVDGRYSSLFAHMFIDFDSVDAIVDQLFETEGQTWVFSHVHHPHPHDHDGGDGR